MTLYSSKDLILLTETFSAPNYSPLPVVLKKGAGVWAWDVEGKRYLDMHSAYSALNFGHANPRIVERATQQLKTLTLTSRAFFTEEFALLSKELVELCRAEMSLIMNSGAEGVETAIKAARRWGYEIKGVPDGTAEIICFSGNFHGRTTTIMSFSDSQEGREHYGPFTPGFTLCPYGDLEAVKQSIRPSTVAILVEPIQGEAGIILPPEGFLSGLRALCDQHRILLICDEIQTGMGRTGALFASDHEQVIPDLYILGKSLGGGIVPISAVVGKREVLQVFRPGTHGSTFGGNPFACAIAREVIQIIQEEKPEQRSAELGTYLLEELRKISSPSIKEIRGRGLFIGIELHVEAGEAKLFCKALQKEGILCKDTRSTTIRIAPPLIITREDLDWALEKFKKLFGAGLSAKEKNADIS